MTHDIRSHVQKTLAADPQMSSVFLSILQSEIQII